VIKGGRDGDGDSGREDLLLGVGSHGVASIGNNIPNFSASEARPNSSDDANSFPA
jgi:hypothetical protein